MITILITTLLIYYTTGVVLMWGIFGKNLIKEANTMKLKVSQFLISILVIFPFIAPVYVIKGIVEGIIELKNQ